MASDTVSGDFFQDCEDAGGEHETGEQGMADVGEYDEERGAGSAFPEHP